MSAAGAVGRGRAHGRGVALVLVLWIVAALTVLVTGIVQAQRGEVRLASAARDRLLSEATGQAAIQQVVQRIVGSGQAVDRLQRVRAERDQVEVVVEVMPMTGLIDLNAAPEPLLAELFVRGAGLEERAASELAAAVIARRQGGAGASARGPRRLDAPEELLAIPGVDPDLFAKIAPLVTTDSGGNGRVHALSAPLDVLLVVARGRADVARRLAEDRDAGQVGVDTTRLDAAFIDGTLGTRLRLSARVPRADGSAWTVVRDIDLRPAVGSGSPWQILRSELRRG